MARPDGLMELHRAEAPDAAFVISRSKNANIVVYQARRASGGREGPLALDRPLDIFWLDVDPAYQRKARAAGRATDRVELSAMEKSMAYGADCRADPARPGHVRVTLVALTSRDIDLYLDAAGRPRADVRIGHETCRLLRVHVESTDGIFGPSVKSITLHGVRDSGEAVSETFRP